MRTFYNAGRWPQRVPSGGGYTSSLSPQKTSSTVSAWELARNAVSGSTPDPLIRAAFRQDCQVILTPV